MPRVLTSTPVFKRIFPWGSFSFVEAQKDKLFQHGLNATGLAVQSSHTGVAIININTCKIQKVRQPFSNIQHSWLRLRKASVQPDELLRPYFAVCCIMLRVVPALLSTLPSVRSWLHYEAAAILCGCAWILLNNCWLSGGGGICLHYIEIETPQELCSDISKQLNQHLCTTASVDCDPDNVNGAAAARSLRFSLAAHETHGVKRKQRSEETAFIPLTSWWRNHWGGSYWIYTASTQFLHEHAEPFSTWSLKFNHFWLFYYYHILP